MIESSEIPKELTQQLAQLLRQKAYRMVVAESCTGGWLAKVLTDLPGSSTWFDRGYVTYSNQAKQAMLGVNQQTLDQCGAVSLETVREMTRGAIHESGAEVAVAISGIAGPGGGSDEKPVGTVCFSFLISGSEAILDQIRFKGDRDQVRRQSVVYALERLIEKLKHV
ncbi:MAG: nicotinamide-nucleotide amidase [Candidatus Thiodiazotropha sp. L084R]